MVRAWLGMLRLAIAFPVIVLATALILLAAPLPITLRGVRLSAWFTTWASRLAMFLFNIRYRAVNAEQFWNHPGFVFANHIS